MLVPIETLVTRVVLPGAPNEVPTFPIVEYLEDIGFGLTPVPIDCPVINLMPAVIASMTILSASMRMMIGVRAI